MDTTSIHKLELSPFDQTIPRLYVHKLFCFPFADPDRQPEAVECLEQALSATVLQWPFITGVVGPAEATTKCNEVELLYKNPAVGKLNKNVLITKNLFTAQFPWTWEQLVEAGFPPSAMKKEVLSTVPEWPKLGETYPALAIQANFINGGLILCFAFHHAVADGGSFCTFLKAFAAATKNPSSTKSATHMDVNKRVGYVSAPPDDIIPLRRFPEYDPDSIPCRPVSTAKTTIRIFTFEAATIQRLEESIKEQLAKTPGALAFVSNIACLSGLVWVAVIRARQARLKRSETAKIGIAVNSRNIMDPKLSEDYFGNAVVHANATAKVSELLNSTNTGETEPNMSIATLTLAASRMRLATQGTDSKYVSERLKTFSALQDPTETSRAYGRAMDTSYTGLDFSSWRDHGADVEFGIPGIGTSTVAWWRKTYSPNEGAYNILPRRGGGKGPAAWEVSLGLSMEDMEKVCSEGELGGWVSRIVE